MMLNGKAWKATLDKGNERCVYRLQVNGINGKNRNSVLKLMSGWTNAGEGFSTKTNEEFIVFSRDFKTTPKWMAWAKAFQGFKLVELDKNGEVKKYIKIGPRGTPTISTPVAKPTKGKRRCGKCGEVGHNARTCKSAFRKADVTVSAAPVQKRRKRVERGPRKCSICGQSGHNARTCKEK